MNEYAFASRLVSIPPWEGRNRTLCCVLDQGVFGGVTCLPYRSVRQWFRLLLYYFLLDVIGVVFLFFLTTLTNLLPISSDCISCMY